MAFSRKDYIVLAGEIKESLQLAPHSHRKTIAMLARGQANALKENNIRFSYVEFFHACGLNEHGELV